MDTLYTVLATVAAYLIGSLSFAVIVSRVMGLKDPRSYGSKNPGATNVLRSGSKAAAVVTLLLDAFKGWLPVVLVKWFGGPYGMEDGTMALVGFDDFDWADFFTPRLTVVRQPLEQQGRLAVQMLLQRMQDANRAPEIRRLIPTQVIRESCGCHLAAASAPLAVGAEPPTHSL